MLSQRQYLDSISTVVQYVNQHTELQAKPWEVGRVMKEELGMRFRRVEKGPVYLNSVRNLILRQQAAFKVLELLGQGKVLINVDETWLNELDFRRMKWREYGTSNINHGFPLSPRITVIAALDTLGNIYLCLTQAHSNNKTMEIYF